MTWRRELVQLNKSRAQQNEARESMFSFRGKFKKKKKYPRPVIMAIVTYKFSYPLEYLRIV